jgi:biopolymer transport protein ExbD
MLIFFIITASFVREAGLVPNFPASPKVKPVDPRPTIGFRIDGANRLFHEGRLVDVWSVPGIIKQGHTENPDAPVVIATNRDAHTVHMIRLYDEALKAGIAAEKIAVTVYSE